MATEKEKLIKQMPYRIHLHEQVLLKQLLRNDELRFQQLIDAFVQAYMRGDREALRIVKVWKDMNIVPEELREQYVMSHRERADILKQIEEEREQP